MFGSLKFSMTSIVKESAALDALREAVKVMQDNDIYIGIPQEENAAHDGADATNAELMYIHTNGSPLKGIPARDILESSMKNGIEQLAELQARVVQAAVAGNVEAVKPAMEKVGMQAANIAKEWFTNPANGWAPNNPATIKAKGSERPLIDSGQMRKSITYVVDKKGARK